MNDFKIDKNWYNNLTEKYNCPYCSKEYSKKGISTHILRTHLNIDSFKNIDNHKKNYKHEKSMCNKCNKEFSNYYMEKHKENCNNEIIYICECCGKQTNVKFGSGRFCSRICANKRVHSQETKEIISKNVLNSIKWLENSPNLKQTIEKENVFFNGVKKAIETKKNKYTKFLLSTDFNNLNIDQKKKIILMEQNFKCNLCGIINWNNKPITLELEHKDGNHYNNLRENLECLCPNCHSQTDTWRGKNKRMKPKTISDEEVVLMYGKSGNIRQTLINLGLVAKGSNYGRVKRVLTLYNIKYI